MSNTAVIDPTGSYRYELWRDLYPDKRADEGRHVCFVLLNPSTADASNDDPTIRRCMEFGRRWGFERLVVVNLFAFRATNPQVMKKARDPIGPDNDWHIRQAARNADLVVAGWGNHGDFKGRSTWVGTNCLPPETRCFAFNLNGTPKHPLYVAADQFPEQTLRPDGPWGVPENGEVAS